MHYIDTSEFPNIRGLITPPKKIVGLTLCTDTQKDSQLLQTAGWAMVKTLCIQLSSPLIRTPV